MALIGLIVIKLVKSHILGPFWGSGKKKSCCVCDKMNKIRATWQFFQYCTQCEAQKFTEMFVKVGAMSVEMHKIIAIVLKRIGVGFSVTFIWINIENNVTYATLANLCSRYCQISNIWMRYVCTTYGLHSHVQCISLAPLL